MIQISLIQIFGFVYLLIILLFYREFKMKIKKLDQKINKVVREIAIRQIK